MHRKMTDSTFRICLYVFMLGPLKSNFCLKDGNMQSASHKEAPEKNQHCVSQAEEGKELTDV